MTRVNVLHLATFDTHGGAAVAALRLVESLRRRGHKARLLVREKATSHPAVEAFGSAAPLSDPALTQMAWLFSQRARSGNRATAFSCDLPTYDVAAHSLVRAADVLHLHWVTGFLSAYEIRRLQHLGKPIVWTLHDQFPMTGGCHYAESCRGFMKACTRCPQLEPDARLLASLTLAEKRHFIDPSRLVLASPSEWLADSVRRSALFRRAKVEVVPYGIDVASRSGVTRDQARTRLQIPADAIVLFTASADQRDVRKGHAHLVDALKSIKRSGRLSFGVDRRLLVLTAGDGADPDGIDGIRTHALGPVAFDDDRLMLAYRAADLFALPSLEDNLPNTLLEALAAGTPAVAYGTGGIPDLLRDGVNGRVVKRGDVRALAAALFELLNDEELRTRLSRGATDTALTRLDWPLQAKAYERIYHREMDRRRPRPRRDRKLRPFADDPHADAGRISDLSRDRRANRLLADLLRKEIDDLQQIIATRGGEIRDLRASAEGLRDHERETERLQEVISARGGEIRELRRALGDARQSAARRKEVIGHLMRGRTREHSSARRLNIGIFGVGDSGRRLLEAAALLDCRIVWLADNNADLHGPTDLGTSVIPPEAIPGLAFDAVIVASAHRDPIRHQLLQLGIPPDRIVAPDVRRTDAELLDDLRRLLEPLQHAGVHSARSTTVKS
jgi:glycosyltransferase involved in cell wall biosynthesis